MKKDNSIPTRHIIDKNDKWLNAIIDASKLAIWDWNTKTGVVKLNKYVAAIFEHQLLDFENTIENFSALIHPDFIESAPVSVKFFTEIDDSFFDYEYKIKMPNGQWKWLYTRGKVVSRDESGLPTRISGIHVDIDERKKTEASLFDAQSIQKAVLNALPDLKFRIDKNGYYLAYFSSIQEEIDLYKNPLDFIGKNLVDVLPKNIGLAYMANIKKTLETDIVQSIEYALEINNSLQFFESRISKVNDNEVIAVVRNITDRMQAQNALREKVRELDIKNQELQKYTDSNELLENFAYIASHDLQEPVRTINSFVQLLKNRYANQLDESAKTYINFIEEGACNINQLIQDLLTYSRINTEELKIEKIEMLSLLQKIEQNLDNLLQKNKVKIITKGLSISIKGSKTKLIQLFQNLITNAVKFARPNENPLIEIEAKDTEGYWLFSVKDNGVGIAPEFHEQIFVLFKKLSNQHKTKGSGLGLAICKRVVQQLNGDIWLTSELEKGTTFFFTIKK